MDGMIEVDGRVLDLEQVMKTLPQVTMAPKHYFADGLYCRELMIPKGTLLTGMIHKKEHIIILFSGELSLWDGDGWARVKAPYFNIAPAGSKRMGYAHEDTVGMNIIATDITDVDEIESALTCKSYEDYQLYLELKEAVCSPTLP